MVLRVRVRACGRILHEVDTSIRLMVRKKDFNGFEGFIGKNGWGILCKYQALRLKFWPLLFLARILDGG